MTDYLATLSEVNAKHGGLLFEQLAKASAAASMYLRSFGYCLPGGEAPPTNREVYRHLYSLLNEALESYHAAQRQAPKDQQPNEIWGYSSGDDLFDLSVTGLTDDAADGYTCSIDMNLLYEDGE